MTDDHQMKDEITRAFQAQPWRGIVPVEEAIAGAILYRQNLSQDECAAYDEAILAGWTPWQAAEAVEILAGRKTPGNTGRTLHFDTEEAPVAKVS